MGLRQSHDGCNCEQLQGLHNNSNESLILDLIVAVANYENLS